MAWKNRNFSYDSNRQNQSNQYAGYQGNNSGWGNSNRSNNAPKKHSGCRVTTASKGTHKGSTVVTGWNWSRRHGLVSFLAAPYSKSEVHKSQSGREWVNYMVKVTPEKQKPYIVSGLLELATKRVIIKELGMVMNPRGGKGGYCGKFGTK